MKMLQRKQNAADLNRFKSNLSTWRLATAQTRHACPRFHRPTAGSFANQEGAGTESRLETKNARREARRAF
ncbi:MAG: hypothetical protein J0J15_16460, partial [Mesorhizobium sp.]|nr:hypothetical protein [Mesorhizobium sp.]